MSGCQSCEAGAQLEADTGLGDHTYDDTCNAAGQGHGYDGSGCAFQSFQVVLSVEAGSVLYDASYAFGIFAEGFTDEPEHCRDVASEDSCQDACQCCVACCVADGKQYDDHDEGQDQEASLEHYLCELRKLLAGHSDEAHLFGFQVGYDIDTRKIQERGNDCCLDDLSEGDS